MEALDGGAYEYRIGVNWFLDISDKPIDVKGIRKRFGYKPRWSPRRIIYRIKQRDVVEQLIRELKRAPSAPKAIDLNPPSPQRVATTAYRIIRDSALARRVKALHKHKCQICGHSIKLPDGSLYAEAHHIQPLGKPHNGPDVIGNILCLCPNHHAELDLRVRKISLSEFAIVDGHAITRRFVDYHNEKIYGWV
jgi:hypothetical protein